MNELADRLLLRELVDRYASAVDRRQPHRVAALFTEDGVLLIHAPGDTEPRRVYAGRDAIERVMHQLSKFTATSHVVGGQLLELAGDRATGETYCVASHIYDTDTGPRMYMMAIRYEDAYIRRDGRWLFAERSERTDWAEDRPFSPADA